MNSGPLLTVCVNTYNHRKFICDAFEGILNQKTTFPFEIIVADDFSSDGTSSIVESYRQRYPRIIRVLKREKNLGAVENGYQLVSSAATPFIAYLEGDDFWIEPTKLQRQVEYLLENPTVGLVWTDIDILDESKGTVQYGAFSNRILKVPQSLDQILLEKPFFAPCTWVYRSSLQARTQRYDYVDGTFPFILEVHRESQVHYLDVVTACYRKLTESASNSVSVAKRLAFLEGVYNIQKKYVQVLGYGDDLLSQVDKRHASALLPYAIAEGMTDRVTWALRELQRSPPSGTRDRLLLIVLGVPFGKMILRHLFRNLTFKDKLSKILRFFPNNI